mgnify:CR=1 FL=1
MLFRGGIFLAFSCRLFFFFFVSVDRLDRFSAFFYKRFRSRNIEWADFPRLFFKRVSKQGHWLGRFSAPLFFKWFKAGPFAGPVSCACSARSSSKQEQKKSFPQPAFYGGSFLIRASENPLSTFSFIRNVFLKRAKKTLCPPFFPLKVLGVDRTKKSFVRHPFIAVDQVDRLFLSNLLKRNLKKTRSTLSTAIKVCRTRDFLALSTPII